LVVVGLSIDCETDVWCS